jgi:hypothetical protein
MLLLLVAVLLAIGAPVGAAYWADPKKNILTESRKDTVAGVERAAAIVKEAVLHRAADYPLLDGLPEWVKHMLLKLLQTILSWLHSDD